MKNVISYVLWGDEDKRWIDLTYAIIANSAIYQGFVTRLYLHESGKASRFYPFIVSLAKKFPELVEIEIIDEPIVGTKLTCYRVKPIWEDDVGLLLCRDLDSITSLRERRATEWFGFHDETFIHSIRAYHLHTVPYMAGLCAFKCQKVKPKIIIAASTFQEYLDWGEAHIDKCKNWDWGCDQALLRDFFGTCGFYKHSMDCPQLTAPLTIVDYPAVLVKESEYENVRPSECNIDALVYSNSIAPSFTGQPYDAQPSQIIELAKIINSDISNMVEEFYA